MRKNSKRRSFGQRLFEMCLTGVSRMALAAGDMIARNPVVAGGATAFLVVMSFVASNAIWYQPQAHDTVFFKTRPEQTFRAIPLDDKTTLRLTGRTIGETTVDTVTNTVTGTVTDRRDNPAQSAPSLSADGASVTAERFAALPALTADGAELPALAPNGDKQIAMLQYNLKTLGFYDGSVDGLTGPQTRKALEQWQAVQAKLNPGANPSGQSQPVMPVAPERADKPTGMTIAEAIAVAVPINKPQRQKSASASAESEAKTAKTIDPSATTASLQPQANTTVRRDISAEELVRIQAGLKAFGNDSVVVDGMPGKATEDAIREFQKLFRLNVSGKADPELIGKMREIGLIS